ncbi:histidine phosphatase family protein [Lichenicoccus roseus]|uniref:Histidine phosphatase family protein n=2 Tax=Lichenicoccus roseus TaxID=2683649 RepID=A0A5R9JCV4_9PROT|nr:histidine phosphatase family protein [Lichenicoccus roseus]TLU74593.1 histidine phosphatase family protein [Lichenicoccus roseus]
MIVLRHCQSEFNLHFTRTKCDPGIVDPVLTPLGEEQAAQAAAALAGQRIDRILVSPYTRALQTAAPIARERGVAPVVTPLIGERCAFVCDIGTPASQLARRWPDIDFSHLEEVWWPQATEQEEHVVARAEQFRREAVALPQLAMTLVVSHWGFLLALSGSSLQNGAFLRIDAQQRPPSPLVWRH